MHLPSTSLEVKYNFHTKGLALLTLLLCIFYIHSVHNSYIKIEIWCSYSNAEEDSSFVGCWLQHLDCYAGTSKHGITPLKA
jgi:hypothetical protein